AQILPDEVTELYIVIDNKNAFHCTLIVHLQTHDSGKELSTVVQAESRPPICLAITKLYSG
ncbi:MAG TPA: hypothetical protein VNS62_04810, partial [Candidatus Udaeobacter sp.]|nr:hypothetical protein [Candidatus Udaeobacter sp.]